MKTITKKVWIIKATNPKERGDWFIVFLGEGEDHWGPRYSITQDFSHAVMHPTELATKGFIDFYQRHIEYQMEPWPIEVEYRY